MLKIGLRTLLGASSLKCLILTVSFALPLPASAQDYDNGQAAYAKRDWLAAENLWLKESEQGSGLALLGLGNLYDFGLVGPSDPERAFNLYLEAAKFGIAEAAFNVAVMQDSGIGTTQNMEGAAAWYAFAALDGHARASYNLGQFFANGVGVGKNDALAEFWLEKAADKLPSAAEALDTLDRSVSGPNAELTAPKPLAMQVVSLPTGSEARMAWQNESAIPGATYRVDLISIETEGMTPIATATTAGSAVSVALSLPDTPFAWRVAQVDTGSYATSGWMTDQGDPLATSLAGVVRFEFEAEDRRAEGLAFRLGGAMARFGSVIVFDSSQAEIETSAVSYRYPQDAALAADIAAFLPGVGAQGAKLIPDASSGPAEVIVTLAFDRSDN